MAESRKKDGRTPKEIASPKRQPSKREPLMGEPKKSASASKKKSERKTERVNVWLTPEQVLWLKGKKNVSETVRALVLEAMSMDALAKSVKPRRRK